MASLGSLLVRRNVLTVQQVRNALTQQVLYGGAFDTVLLEHGCCESDVVEAISGITSLPPMTSALVRCASPEVAELLSIERSLALDVCLTSSDEDGKVFALAGARADWISIDELAFELERPLSVYAAPELRMWQARAAVFGVEIPARYVELDARILRRARDGSAPGVEHLPALASAS